MMILIYFYNYHFPFYFIHLFFYCLYILFYLFFLLFIVRLWTVLTGEEQPHIIR